MMLADMQRDFQQWLVNADDGAPLQRQLASSLGLAAYQNNYRSQLVSVLRASYPQLLSRMGDEAFLSAAVHHIDHHPPSSWTLDDYGMDFRQTLRVMYPHNPDLEELAWIEWALSESFVAPDATGIAIHELGDVDWDHARLRLTPSFRQQLITTNVVDVWSALQEQDEPVEAEMLDAQAGVIVWRRAFSSLLRKADPIEHLALLSLLYDGSFNAMCDVVVEHLGETDGVSRAGSLLADWINSGIVVAVDVGD
ncbi:DNA-binding domain-containing protein [Dyella silvae]|uniref:HvfC/BufC N-terminal domain-containing protein n=1 Tax=Dyella silvae TaxID=2994424 RepID=UPI002263BEF0|nr:DNA-binding domain-containing protein [Dyella silvae]